MTTDETMTSPSAAPSDLSQVLHALIQLVERQSAGMLASILLLGPDRVLRHGAAPSLPDAYNRAMDGLTIGEGTGSSGTAAHRGEPVIVSDVQTDPLWREYRILAAEHGLRACWSTPITGRQNEVLGTFALYYQEPRAPSESEIDLIRWAAQLAATAIEGQRTEAALRLQEAKLREIFNRAPAIIATLRGPNHVFETANRLYEDAVGRRDLVGHPIAEALPELAGQGIIELLDGVYQNGHPYCANELRVVLNRGSDSSPEEAFFNFVYQPLFEADGAVSGILVHAVEVTEQVRARRQTEKQAAELEMANREMERANDALRTSEQQFRTLAESIPQLTWIAEPDGHIFWYNERWYSYTGTTPEEMEGWGWQKVHDPDFLPRVLDRWKSSLESAEPFDMEFPLRGRDGIFRWFLTRVMPVKGADGRVTRWFGTNTDIDEQRRLVQERDRALRGAEEARMAAEIANRAKSGFLANMSHELRTPINAIIGYTDLLAMEITGGLNDPQRAQLERIRVASQHLLSVINDLLDLARIESGQIQVARNDVQLHSVVQQAVAIMEAQAKKRGIELVDEASSDLEIRFLGDEDRVRQILANLVGNAIKFTLPGGWVRIGRRITTEMPRSEVALVPGPWLCVDIEDNGIGIPEDQLDAIFDPFIQVGSGLTREQEGTGLGLTISRNLARQMGGELTVASQAGEGSRFTLWLCRLTNASELSPDWVPPHNSESPA